jgi:pimeloyl-ACP methyl ester carboxylesterase
MSYGGFLALNLALASPAMVDKMVLLAPGVKFAPPTGRWLWGMPMILWPSPFTVRLFFNRASLRGYPPRDPELVQLMTGIPGLRSRIPLQPSFSDEELGRLAVPTLFLVGDHEMLYDAESAVRRACELCPGLQAEVIADAGHTLSTDQPDAVNARIKSFLKTGT